MTDQPTTYESAGVSIEAGDRAVELMKVYETIEKKARESVATEVKAVES